jgi:hypothetical protein
MSFKLRDVLHIYGIPALTPLRSFPRLLFSIYVRDVHSVPDALPRVVLDRLGGQVQSGDRSTRRCRGILPKLDVRRTGGTEITFRHCRSMFGFLDDIGNPVRDRFDRCGIAGRGICTTNKRNRSSLLSREPSRHDSGTAPRPFGSNSSTLGPHFVPRKYN